MKSIISLLIILFFTANLKAQVFKDSSIDLTNVAPRFGVGATRGLILEAGLSLMRSQYTSLENVKEVNATCLSLYSGIEVVATFGAKHVTGYKLGVEGIAVGHNIMYFASEFIYYRRNTEQTPMLFLKLGIPMIHGGISYGYGIFFNQDLRKEIGKHRLSITYILNKKGSRAFHKVLNRTQASR